MRTFNTIGRHLLVAAFIGLLFGCAEQAPKAEAPTEAVVAVSEAAEAPAAAPPAIDGCIPELNQFNQIIKIYI